MKGLVTISGIARQDGSYPAKFLVSQGCEVHGIVRPVASADATCHLSRLDAIGSRIFLQRAKVGGTFIFPLRRIVSVAREAAVHVSG